METREFPTAVIASISSGIALAEFSKIHEAAEYLLGHPILTHQFANKELWKAMRRKVLEQCPGMPILMTGVTPENYQQRVAMIEEDFGPTVVIRKGGGETAMHLLDGIPEGKPIVVVSE